MLERAYESRARYWLVLVFDEFVGVMLAVSVALGVFVDVVWRGSAHE